MRLLHVREAVKLPLPSQCARSRKLNTHQHRQSSSTSHLQCAALSNECIKAGIAACMKLVGYESISGTFQISQKQLKVARVGKTVKREESLSMRWCVSAICQRPLSSKVLTRQRNFRFAHLSMTGLIALLSKHVIVRLAVLCIPSLSLFRDSSRDCRLTLERGLFLKLGDQTSFEASLHALLISIQTASPVLCFVCTRRSFQHHHALLNTFCCSSRL